MADLSLATGTFAVQSMRASDASGGAGACEISHPIVTDPDAVTVTNPGPQASYRGYPATLQITAASDYGYPLTYQATGLPPGMLISSSTGLISGAATLPGNFQVTVTATDTHGMQGSATFTWTVQWVPQCKPTTCP